MSDRSRKKKGKAQGRTEPQKPVEKPQTEKSQPEKAPAEKSQTEKAKAEKPQTEKSQTEKSQTEKSQTEKPQTEKPQTEKALPGKHQGAVPTPVGVMADQSGQEKKQRLLIIILAVLAAIAAVATALVLLYVRWVQKPNLPPEPSQAVSEGISSSSVPSIAPGSGSEAPPDIDAVQPLAGGERRSKDFYTMLIFGTDQVSGLTDTIMVASYDVTNQKAAVMSIPRDTMINNKTLYPINATYSMSGQGEKGTAALKTEVTRLIGFVPDYYVLINWELVGQMVDAIGGVEFKVPWRMKYDDPTQDLHIDLMPGLQTLNGPQAMQLVRWRSNNRGVSGGGGDGSDLGRLNIQHDFLKAVLEQTLKPQNIVRVPELIRLFNENVVSDLSVENMLWFGQEAVLGKLSVDDVKFLTMPIYGTSNTRGRYYGRVCPVKDQLLTIINESLNPYVEDVTERHLDLIQISKDGNTLSSTTGVLRNPAAGVHNTPSPAESKPPKASNPVASNPGTPAPAESDPGTPAPAESDPGTPAPAESDPGTPAPLESDPGTPAPAESDPGTPAPVESDPGPGRTDDPPPESGPPVTDGGELNG